MPVSLRKNWLGYTVALCGVAFVTAPTAARPDYSRLRATLPDRPQNRECHP